MTVPMECPLCGGEARLGLTNRGGGRDTVTVYCVDCSCGISRTGPTQSEAAKREVVEAWNTRVGAKND
jgi:hypothetical protein